MMRKKISPVLIISWLLILTLITFLSVLYVSAASAQRLYGKAMQEYIFEVNDLTDDISDLLDDDSQDAITLSNLSGRLSSCAVGSGINEDFEALTQKTAVALCEYADALGSSSISPTALAVLKSDAAKYSDMLHDAAQYVMSLLESGSEKKMHKAYFDASVFTEHNNKLITSYVKSLQD